jgi:hypothetical protein
VAAGLLVASLVAVVVAHTMEAADQVQLSNTRAQLAAEQVTHQQLETSVAQLEAPQRIAQSAEQQLHMSTPTHAEQVPYTSLGTALPPPNVTPAPPSTTPTTSASNSRASNSTSSTTGAGASAASSGASTSSTTASTGSSASR